VLVGKNGESGSISPGQTYLVYHPATRTFLNGSDQPMRTAALVPGTHPPLYTSSSNDQELELQTVAAATVAKATGSGGSLQGAAFLIGKVGG
jgi:hypothetical protein